MPEIDETTQDTTPLARFVAATALAERADRAEAALHDERKRRIAAEETAAQLAELLSKEVAERRRAERIASDMAKLVAHESARAESAALDGELAEVSALRRVV
jgi:hypothetical protein